MGGTRRTGGGCSGIDEVDRMRAGRGAGSGLVVMKRVAAKRSGLGGGVCNRLGFAGIWDFSDFFFSRRFLGPSLTFIREKSATRSSMPIIGDRFIDLAG